MLKTIFAKKITWVILIIVIAAGGYFVYQKFLVKKESPYLWAEAAYGDIREIVSETGKVKPVEEINLNFKNSGTLSEARVKVGDEVKAGDALMILDTADLEMKVREAEAARDAASAKLQSVLAGATTEDIKVYETAVKNAEASLANLKKSAAAEIANAQKSLASAAQTVTNAETALTDAETNLSNVQNSAENSLDDAYEAAKVEMDGNLVTMSTALGDMDNILGIDDTTANDAFEANLGVYSPQTKIDAESSYQEAKTAYSAAVTTTNGISDFDHSKIDVAIPIIENGLTKVSDALYKTRIMLDNSLVSSILTLTDLTTKKTTINTDRQSVNTALSSLQTDKQAIASAKLTNQTNISTAETAVNVAESNLAVAQKNKETSENNLTYVQTAAAAKLSAAEGDLRTAQDQLALKKARPKEADIAYYRAEVRRTEATLDLVKKQKDDATLLSPIDGIVTKVNFEAGEAVLSTSVAVAMISSNNFQIEADVSELDINKIALNDVAEVAFDAISSDKIFKGKVITIDPAEKIKDDDIYYRVVVILDEKEPAVKSGMTADIDIITDSKSNALLIPKRAVIKEGAKKQTRLLVNETMQTVEIEIGLEGDEMVEVLSGVKEGDKVVTFVKE